MARPKRHLLATAEETVNPPVDLEPSQVIAQIAKAEGKNLYTVDLPNGKNLLVELASRFRSQIWIKRHGFVVIDTAAFEDRDNKLDGEIVNIIREDKQWRKQAYWPVEFAKKPDFPEDSDEDDSTSGKMPPTENHDDE